MDREIIKVTEKLVLKEFIGETCCIFRAPPLLLETNPLALKPSIVSLGPYHIKDERLQMIHQHKHRFSELFIETANQRGGSISMLSLENVVGDLEQNIRDSYSEPLQLSREKLVKMMVLDGCFILILILVESDLVTLTNPNDTIYTLPLNVSTLMSDLLLLENQVPYTLLETLFRELGFPSYVDLKRLICKFFESSLGYMSEKVLENTKKIQPGHILHLIQEAIIPPSGYKTRAESHSAKTTNESILSAKTLQMQGIKFKANRNAETILDIELEKNKLLIPPLILNKLMGTVLLNGVAFEQCSRICGDDITDYMILMGFLMKDKEDALFIINEKIIENCFGTNEEFSHFFKDINESVVFSLRWSKLAPVFRGVNAYTSRRHTRPWMDFKRNYIGSFSKRN